MKPFPQDFTFKRFISVYIGSGVFFLLMHTFVLTTFGLTLVQSLFDALLTIGLILLAGTSTYNILRYYKPARENILYPRIWAMLLTILVTMVFTATMKQIYEGQKDYLDFLSASIPVRGVYHLLIISLLTVFVFMWFLFQEEHERQKNLADIEKLTRDAELVSLRQQLQPHFLFNSLNSISALVGNRPEEARKMIYQLSEFLRGTLRKDEYETYEMSGELHHLQLYLDIEKVRFGHRLTTTILADDLVRSCKIPPLILQPLVENAIKFGLYDIAGEVNISIVCSCNSEYLTITITNPFDPQTATPKKGAGFGISSVQRRLYLLYARNDLLQTGYENNLFTTIVKIPQKI